jgi:hypothetical protein
MEGGKKKSKEIRRAFLSDRAQFMAEKMRTVEEKALKAILSSEASRKNYATT